MTPCQATMLHHPRPSLLACLALLAGPSTAQVFELPSQGADTVIRSDEHGNRALAVVGHRAQGPTTQLGLDPAWSAVGPFGGDVEDVARQPGTDVVLTGLAPNGGSGGTLYRSTDNGDSWTEVPDLAGTSVHDLEWVGASSDTVWAGTIDGPFVSTDAGASWTARPLGIGLNDQTFEVTLDPGDPNSIWVGVADALGGQIQNVLHSTDGGLNWSNRTPPGAAGTTCRAIAVNPTDSDEIYAAFGPAFGGGSVWVSFDRGLTWANRTSNLPSNPMRDLLYLEDGRVWVCGGLAFGSQFVGVFETTDDGVSWQAIHDGSWPSLVVNDLELVPAGLGSVWAATAAGPAIVPLSGGATQFPLQALSVNEVDQDSTVMNSDTVFLGNSSNAVWKHSLSGGTYEPSSTGIGQLNVFSVDDDPINPDILAIAFQGLNDGGVYTSIDGGQLWNLEPLPGTRFSDVAFDPTGLLYAISDGPTTIAPEALYRRSPGSGTWINIGPDQGSAFESELLVIEFDPADPQYIVAAGSDFGLAGAEPTVWVTDNGGTMWSKTYEGAVENEDVTDLAYVQTNGSQVMVASFRDLSSDQTGGALRSTDAGQSWQDSSTGLPADAQGESITTNRLLPDTFFYADNDFGAGGLYRSDDAGQTWSLVNAVDRILRVDQHPFSARALRTAHTSGVRARISTDSGATLDAFDAGLADAGFVRDATIADTGARAYLATSTGTWARGLDPVVPYCTTSPNSVGNGAAIAWSGSTSIAANDLVLTCSGLPATQPGLFYYGPGQLRLPFGNGLRCVAAAGGFVVRLPILNSDASGNASFSIDYTQLTGIATIPAGSTRFFQFWYRDPAGGGSSFNLSDALAASFLP